MLPFLSRNEIAIIKKRFLFWPVDHGATAFAAAITIIGAAAVVGTMATVVMLLFVRRIRMDFFYELY